MEFLETLGIATYPVITIIVFLACELVKATELDNKWLPVIAGSFGGALGVVAMYVMKDFIAQDPLTAIAIGIMSGLAATGAHQVVKQLIKGKNQPVNTEPYEDYEPDEYDNEH